MTITTKHHRVFKAPKSDLEATHCSGINMQPSKSYTSFDKPALNAWLLSLSIIKKRGLRVKGIISPGQRLFEPEKSKTKICYTDSMGTSSNYKWHRNYIIFK